MSFPLAKATFILLPSFDFDPNTTLKLGSILGRTKSRFGLRSSNYPDPTRLFNSPDDILPIPPTTTQIFKDFHFEFKENHSSGFGVSANVPLVTAVGASLGFSRESVDGLEIDCRYSDEDHNASRSDLGDPCLVERTTFEPSVAYISEAIEGNKLVKDYVTKDRWHLRNKSVFLVTGLMIVRGKAKVKIVQNTAHNKHAKVTADTTITGIVPLNVGIGGDRHQASENTRNMQLENSFILAYRLRRIRVHHDGQFASEEGYTKFALMADTAHSDLVLDNEEVSLQMLDEDWNEADSEVDSDDGNDDL